MARKPRAPTPNTPTPTPGGGTPGASPAPIRWGNIDLTSIASRLGLPKDAAMNAVVASLAKKGATPAEIAQFVLDGQAALDYIDGSTPTVNNIDPNTAATDVDLDDPDPATQRMTPEELRAYLEAAVAGAGSGATRDLRLSGGGITVSGTYRRPPTEAVDAPAGDKKKSRPGKTKEAAPPKKGDPNYFQYQDDKADRWWRENLNMNPPVGAKTVRRAMRNAGSLVTVPAIVAGAGYGLYQAGKAALPFLSQFGGSGEQGGFRKPSDDQLLQEEDSRLMVPADGTQPQQPTMQPMPDQTSLLMRLQQSRQI